MRIDLQENGDPVDVEIDERVGVALRTSGVVTAVPSIAPGWWTIGPAGKVGVAQVADVELWIKPKLDIRRLFFLIGYATDQRIWRDEDLGLAEDVDLLTAIATAFARQADRATEQGLLQGYRVEEDALPVLRGRLRTTDQLSRRYGLAVPLEVRYDEYDVDIPENQLLRGAADVSAEGARDRPDDQATAAAPGPVDGRRHPRRSRPGAPPMATVAAQRPLPHGAAGWPSWCCGVGRSSRGRARSLVSGFLLDMAKVFEDFVTTALGSALSVREVTAARRIRWHLDEAREVTDEA